MAVLDGIMGVEDRASREDQVDYGGVFEGS